MDSYGLGIALEFEDNASKEIEKAISNLNKLEGAIDQIAKSSEESGKQVDKFQGMAGSISKSFYGVSDTLNAVSSGMRSIGYALLPASVALGGLAVKSIQTALGFMQLKESTRISFDVLLGGLDKADKMMDDLYAHALTTPFSYDTFLQTGKHLVTMGVDANNVVGILDVLTNSAIASGEGQYGLERLTNAYGQMASLGKISTRPLQSMMEMGLPVIKIFGNALNASTEEVYSLISSGEMMSDEYLPILLQGLKEGTDGIHGQTAAYDELAEKMQNTMAGALDKFRSRFRNISIAVWSAEDAFPSLITLVRTFTDSLNILPILLQGITEAVKPAIEKVNEWLLKFTEYVKNADPEQIKKIGDIIVKIALAGPGLLFLNKVFSGLSGVSKYLGDAFKFLDKTIGKEGGGKGIFNSFKSLGGIVITVMALFKAYEDNLFGFKTFVDTKVVPVLRDLYEIIRITFSEEGLNGDNLAKANELGLVPILENTIALKDGLAELWEKNGWWIEKVFVTGIIASGASKMLGAFEALAGSTAIKTIIGLVGSLAGLTALAVAGGAIYLIIDDQLSSYDRGKVQSNNQTTDYDEYTKLPLWARGFEVGMIGWSEKDKQKEREYQLALLNTRQVEKASGSNLLKEYFDTRFLGEEDTYNQRNPHMIDNTLAPSQSSFANWFVKTDETLSVLFHKFIREVEKFGELVKETILVDITKLVIAGEVLKTTFEDLPEKIEKFQTKLEEIFDNIMTTPFMKFFFPNYVSLDEKENLANQGKGGAGGGGGSSWGSKDPSIIKFNQDVLGMETSKGKKDTAYDLVDQGILTSLPKDFTLTGLQSANGLADGMWQGEETIKGATQHLYGLAVSGIDDDGVAYWTAGHKDTAGYVEGHESVDAVTPIKAIALNILEKVKGAEAFNTDQGASSAFGMIGQDNIKGYNLGAESIDTEKPAKGIIDKIIGFFKAGLRQKSPSRVFFDIGQNTIFGFLEGMDSEDLGNFTNILIDNLVETFKSGAITAKHILSVLGEEVKGILSKIGISFGSTVSELGKPVDTDVITSAFGWRTDPITGEMRWHSGVDFGAGFGANIYATGDGVVSTAGWHDGYGNHVIIDHGNGLQTLYGHMSSILTSAGSSVSIGDVIGLVGSTGRSTGPHLHYELRQDGQAIDPGFAIGTNKFRGGRAFVNERGGEIINLPSGSQILPHDKTVEVSKAQGEVEAYRNMLIKRNPVETPPQNIDNSLQFTEGSIVIQMNGSSDTDFKEVAKKLMRYIDRERQLKDMSIRTPIFRQGV